MGTTHLSGAWNVLPLLVCYNPGGSMKMSDSGASTPMTGWMFASGNTRSGFGGGGAGADDGADANDDLIEGEPEHLPGHDGSLPEGRSPEVRRVAEREHYDFELGKEMWLEEQLPTSW